jgi:predicted nuclease of predicted toxin-antitoxin system
MLVLADENFPLPTVDVMRAAGHDVLWARSDCPGCADTALLERAEAESRLVLTLDKDFWQIALQRRAPLERSGVILFRVHPATPANVTPVVQRVLGTEREWRGHISVVTVEGIQMVPARGTARAN